MAFIPDCVGRRHVACASPLLRGALPARMLGQRCGIHSTLSGDVGTFLKSRGERTPKKQAAKSSTTPPKGPRRVPETSGIFGNLSGTLRECFGTLRGLFGDPSLCFCPQFSLTLAGLLPADLPNYCHKWPARGPYPSQPFDEAYAALVTHTLTRTSARGNGYAFSTHAVLNVYIYIYIFQTSNFTTSCRCWSNLS